MTSTHIEVRQEPDVVVARLVGDVDLADTPAIAGQVLAAISNAAAGLVVDLTAVRYLDSAGIQMLFEFARQLEAGRQGMAVVVEPDSPLCPLLDMTGLAQAVTICATDTEAVAAVQRGAIRRY